MRHWEFRRQTRERQYNELETKCDGGSRLHMLKEMTIWVKQLQRCLNLRQGTFSWEEQLKHFLNLAQILWLETLLHVQLKEATFRVKQLKRSLFSDRVPLLKALFYNPSDETTLWEEWVEYLLLFIANLVVESFLPSFGRYDSLAACVGDKVEWARCRNL